MMLMEGGRIGSCDREREGSCMHPVLLAMLPLCQGGAEANTVHVGCVQAQGTKRKARSNIFI